MCTRETGMYMYLPVSRQLLYREIKISMNLASVECTPVFVSFISTIRSWALVGSSGFYRLVTTESEF